MKVAKKRDFVPRLDPEELVAVFAELTVAALRTVESLEEIKRAVRGMAEAMKPYGKGFE